MNEAQPRVTLWATPDPGEAEQIRTSLDARGVDVVLRRASGAERLQDGRREGAAHAPCFVVRVAAEDLERGREVLRAVVSRSPAGSPFAVRPEEAGRGMLLLARVRRVAPAVWSAYLVLVFLQPVLLILFPAEDDLVLGVVWLACYVLLAVVIALELRSRGRRPVGHGSEPVRG